jgi:hypothetical protein
VAAAFFAAADRSALVRVPPDFFCCAMHLLLSLADVA